MDKDTRDELEKLHGRVSDLKTRVTVLETNYPHIALKLDKIDGNISRLVWLFVAAFVAAFAAFILGGGLKVTAGLVG